MLRFFAVFRHIFLDETNEDVNCMLECDPFLIVICL